MEELKITIQLESVRSCTVETSTISPVCDFFKDNFSRDAAIGWLKIQHSAVEHRGAHCKQDQCYQAASLQEQHYSPSSTGEPLHNCRQASDSQLLTSWVSPKLEAQPCHVCPWAVGTVTGRSVSRTIRDWVVVHRHRRI